VGLDIVRSSIESLGGQIKVESKINEGTKFIITLPLTSAIIQALLVQVANETYALSINSIEEVYDVPASCIKQSQGEKFFILRDEMIHLIYLHDKLNLSRADLDLDQEICVVVISKGDKKLGLIVDRLIGQQKVVVKSLGNFLNNLSNISGVTILGNGEIALILDIRNID
jgi:two-component system chemotaxis sensor kinase CheA